MARTFPRTLHDEDLKSRAERRVFEALRDQLSDEWSVFHSASVIYRDHAQGARDDEGDFVLCHPDRGIICLEVKGGGLECRHGTFYRLPAGGGERERMPDPFGRAIDHRYALQRKIAEVEGWKDDDLFLVHALAFPDISVHRLVLGPDAPPQIIADRNDLSNMAAVIERVLAYHEGSRDKRVAPGPDGEAMLEQLLAPTPELAVAEARAGRPLPSDHVESAQGRSRRPTPRRPVEGAVTGLVDREGGQDEHLGRSRRGRAHAAPEDAGGRGCGWLPSFAS